MRKRKTHEEFLMEIETIHNSKINVIDKYNGAKNKINVECTLCLHKWKTTPDNLLKCGCPKCALSKKSKSRTKSTEGFKSEIFILVENEYTLLSEYIKANEKITLRHNACDFTYEVTPNNFLNGKRCPKCFGNIKKTTKQFKEDVFNLVGNEYSVIGEYLNNQTKIEMLHHFCEKSFSTSPSHFLSGRRCPYCAGRSWSDDDFKEFVLNTTGDEYTVLGVVSKLTEEVLFFHKKCESKFLMKPSNFKYGSRCTICANNTMKNTELFKDEVEKLVGSEYQVLGEYIGAKSKIEMLHEKCNNTYYVTPCDFTSKGSRCPYCNGKKVSVNNCLEAIFPEVAKEWNYKRNIKHPNEYTPYSNHKVWWVCSNGHEWESVINNRTGRGRSCPNCSESKGEKEIRKWLECNKFNFTPQYQFDDLTGIGGGLLRFDFGILDDKYELRLLIEYDGIFHYEKQYEEDGHERLLEHDERKNAYCKNNRIQLLRIPYWDFDRIEGILHSELED